MLFNSLDYLLFLSFALAAYWWLVARGARVARLVVILLLSCVFYAAWEPAYLVLIVFSTVADWFVARNIAANDVEAPLASSADGTDAKVGRPVDDATRAAAEQIRKRWVAVSVVVNLTLLGTFKYYDFAATSVAQALSLFHIEVAPPLLHWALPVGISFYTFESLSYCIDVYRRKCAPAKSPLELLFFITFFPKLVAGPIARPADLLPQIEREPVLDADRVGHGLFLIATGLVKKVAFADFVSVNLVDRVFETPEGYTATEAIVALYGFTLQIYMDFSGYTDIARGSGKLFGIELPENFDRPYQATSPAEFWRRWHMTLSTWLRDYLYFPLGGSRLGERRTYINLWLTIFLIGLWHGAAWTFVLYGTIQATAVVLHRAWTKYRERRGRAPSTSPLVRALAIFGTLQFVVFTRVLFRASSLENAGDVLERLTSHTYSTANVAPSIWLILITGFALHYTPRHWWDDLQKRVTALPPMAQGAAMALVIALLMHVATTEAVPYIYFQF